MTKPVAKEYIMSIAPYVPGKASADDGRKVIKLSANENPLGTSPAARAAFEGVENSVHLYPDPTAHALRQSIAQAYNIEAERIIYGTGSDEVLHMACGTFAGLGDEAIYVRYGFSVYDIAIKRVGAVPIVVDDHDYGTDVDAILAAVTDRTKLIFVANPNNPTGTYSTKAEIARLHAGLRPDILLVIDQAYAEYLYDDEDDGGLDLARTASNVLITRTFSKIHGLASERIGWGYASSDIINAMHRIRAPFPFSIAGQAAAKAAVEDKDWVRQSRDHNRQWLDWFCAEINGLSNHGIRVVPSKANFALVLFEGALQAETAYNGLIDAGYIVRWLPGQGLPHGLRITIGTENQCRDIATAIRRMAETA